MKHILKMTAAIALLVGASYVAVRADGGGGSSTGCGGHMCKPIVNAIDRK